ncbi:MAG: EAL domain-containing protein [Campylobacterota bacterium]|nr:EAL domain-containing protein [Campylobacterota bacterium]
MSKVKLINKKLLYFIPIFFLIVVLFRIVYAYNDTKNKEYQFAQKKAEVLNSYVVTHRDYYQKFFIDKTIPLNAKTLLALPAFSAAPISKEFSKNNPLSITVKTVSDRARNPKNMVDKDELKAIKYFKENSKLKEYFNGENDLFYQYGYALRIEQKCLSCHGSKHKAPKFIQDRYTNAYDYKLGEIRGIVSIKIPKDILDKYFFQTFINSVIYDILLLILLFGFIFYLFKKSRDLNEVLEFNINKKTKELKDQNSFLNGYVHALDNSTALTKTDINGTITYANKKFLKDTGYLLDELIGNTHKIVLHPDNPKKIFENMWKRILDKKIWNGVIKGLRKDKTEFISKVSIVPILDDSGDIIEFIAARVDITELILNKEKIKKSLVTDSLTKFPNRQKLIDDIKNLNNKKSYLALLNIDRFKEINDFYGHNIADEILIKVANKLKSLTIQEKVTIYKLPSDEYAILTNASMPEEQFLSKIENIVSILNETKFVVEQHNVFVTFSCGVVIDTDSVMIKADMALQNAKTNKKHIKVYDDSLDMSKKITQNIQGVAILNEAIQYNNIVPYFQPIYNLHTKRVEKYECLARIIQKDGSIIAPFKFMDIAIKSKLYPNITKNILSKSFAFFNDLDYEFSINLSIEDIINQNTVKFIIDSLESFTNPSRVVFEILETEEIENYGELKDFIKKVKQYGCQIAIDDFGSGYSNFAHILELNIDYLKIDASLVKNISTDENSKKITQTIINFTKDLGMKTIAEFVEDELSLNILETMGCDYIQGYYIGKPQVGLKDDNK